MFTQVKTPQDIFFAPQRLLVPLFQRPYVWSQDGQWAPLWDDVRRVSERIAKQGSSDPHFLGAVVLQQQPNEIGTMSVRTVIDGQQRLTTLQLLLDAIHEQLKNRGMEGLAKQLQDLVENQAHFTRSPEEAYKVWPTNRDRLAFNEVMSALSPVEYSKLEFSGNKLVQAHEFFFRQVGDWLDEKETSVRADALVLAVQRFLVLVVIDLTVEEDAQEIFETLNARGTPLTAADLIKNFVFQRLEVSPEGAEIAYNSYWRQFETPFWETEISAGRFRFSRSSLFLTQWLVSQIREDITTREVFSQFKHFAVDSQVSTEGLLAEIKASADVYQGFTEAAAIENGALSRLELFVYRTSTMDSEVTKPFLLWVLDPSLPEIPNPQLEKALLALESWLVRRVLMRLTTKRYNQLMLDLLTFVVELDREHLGDHVELFLANQRSVSSYWPGDSEIINELKLAPIYKRIARSRLRMILEAVEDSRRGWSPKQANPMSEQPVVRSRSTIEHVMPQEWRLNWPGEEHDQTGQARDSLVHQLGNLTLVTQALNSKLSNDNWSNKSAALQKHSTYLLTSEVLGLGADGWEPELIHSRTQEMISEILRIWPVPEGHTGEVEGEISRTSSRITISDLVGAGYLRAGQSIFARTQAHRGHPALISEDGSIFVDGLRDETPSGAARKVTKSIAEDGWWFWLVDLETDTSLADIRSEYVSSLSVDEADNGE